MKIFSIYDGKIRSFMRPFMDAHTGSALRSFEEACKEPTSPFAKFPADFVLYEIGTFNTETGLVSPYSPVNQIAAAIDYVRAPMRSSGVAEIRDGKPQYAEGAL